MFSDYFLFRIGDVTIMQKGKADVISDGKTGILESLFFKISKKALLGCLSFTFVIILAYFLTIYFWFWANRYVVFMFLKLRKWVLLVPQDDVVVKVTSFLEGLLWCYLLGADCTFLVPMTPSPPRMHMTVGIGADWLQIIYLQLSVSTFPYFVVFVAFTQIS